MELHLEADERLTVREAHDLSDEVEREMKRRLGGGRVVIHAEPREE